VGAEREQRRNGAAAHQLRGLFCIVVGSEAPGLREDRAIACTKPPVVATAVVLEDQELHRRWHVRVGGTARELPRGAGLLWCGAHGNRLSALLTGDRPGSEKSKSSLSAPSMVLHSDLRARNSQPVRTTKGCRHAMVSAGHPGPTSNALFTPPIARRFFTVRSKLLVRSGFVRGGRGRRRAGARATSLDLGSRRVSSAVDARRRLHPPPVQDAWTKADPLAPSNHHYAYLARTYDQSAGRRLETAARWRVGIGPTSSCALPDRPDQRTSARAW
jgi:hypothetical protein